MSESRGGTGFARAGVRDRIAAHIWRATRRRLLATAKEPTGQTCYSQIVAAQSHSHSHQIRVPPYQRESGSGFLRVITAFPPFDNVHRESMRRGVSVVRFGSDWFPSLLVDLSIGWMDGGRESAP